MKRQLRKKRGKKIERKVAGSFFAKESERKTQQPGFFTLEKILFFILIILVIISMLFLLSWKSSGENGTTAPHEKSVAVYTDRDEYVEGDNISISVESTCGNVSLLIDGKEIRTENENDAFSASLTAAMGMHNITAEGDGCEASRSVTVLERECSENETESCVINGCDGYKPCVDGRFEECRKNRRVCKQGSRIGCPLNSCSFGYATCNECGTGYGPCEPR